VRGDSLRDLYAKALALLGLGLLGAAGALVDYWPVQGELPAVQAKLALPPAFELPAFVDFHLSQPVVAAPKRVVSVVPDVTTGDAADMLAAGAADTQSESAEPAAILPPSLAVAAVDASRMPASALDLTPPVISAPEPPPSAAPVPFEQNGDNVFTGAAKKSGHAMAKTGSAIANGFATGFTSVASAFGRVFRF
jgi:hypothetical protein